MQNSRRFIYLSFFYRVYGRHEIGVFPQKRSHTDIADRNALHILSCNP